MKNKYYIAECGTYFTEWTFSNYKIFKTKKALINYMNELHGVKFKKNNSEMYDGEDHYENDDIGYGFNIEEVSLVEELK